MRRKSFVQILVAVLSLLSIVSLASCSQSKEQDPFLLQLSCPPRETFDAETLLDNLPEVPDWPDWVLFNREREPILSGPVVCHGYHHGHLVVSNYNSSWWEQSYYILGDGYFFGGQIGPYTSTICFDLKEGVSISYEDIWSESHRPLRELYCEGVFTDEEVSQFALEDLAAKKDGLIGEELAKWKAKTTNLLNAAYNGYEIPCFKNTNIVDSIEVIPYSTDIETEIIQSLGGFRTISQGVIRTGTDGQRVVENFQIVDWPVTEDVSSMLLCGESNGFKLLTSVAPQTQALSNGGVPLERDYYPFNGCLIEGRGPAYQSAEATTDFAYKRTHTPFNYSRSFNREFYFGERGYPIYAYKNGVLYEAAALYLAGSLPKSAFSMVARALYSYDLDRSSDKEAFKKKYLEEWNRNYKDGGQPLIIT